MTTINPLPHPCPVADIQVIESFMADPEFVCEVVDGIFEDKTWAALGEAFAQGGRTENLKFHNLGEKFAELFRAEAWNLAQSRINTEWEQRNHDFDF